MRENGVLPLSYNIFFKNMRTFRDNSSCRNGNKFPSVFIRIMKTRKMGVNSDIFVCTFLQLENRAEDDIYVELHMFFKIYTVLIYTFLIHTFLCYKL